MDRKHIAILLTLCLVAVLNIVAVIAAKRIATRGRSGQGVTGASIVIAFIATCFLAYSIYAYYINDWAGLILIPAALLIGVPTLVAFLILAFRRCVNWKCFVWALPVWVLVWIALAKPYGIVCRVAVREARSSFFLPVDAVQVKLTPPGRYGGAVVWQTCYSRLSTDELLAFYSNEVARAGFTVIETRPSEMQVDGPFYPYHILTYRTTAGKYCNVWVFENVPYKGLEDTRSIRLEYCFNPAFGAPVVGL